MATGGNNRLSCINCMKTYPPPIQLPCSHTFCRRCLQAQFGSYPSFHCPVCHTVVRVPPGGVGKQQTNFDIEEDMDTTSSLCDVPADDRDTTSSLSEVPAHDRDTTSSLSEVPADHMDTSSSLSEVPADHRDTTSSLSEVPADDRDTTSSLSEVPAHDRDTTSSARQNLSDVCSDDREVKAKMQDRLETLTQDINRRDQMIGAFDDRCTKLQHQQQSREQECQDRAQTLHQWVDQSPKEAVTSLQCSRQEVAKCWQDQAKQLHNRNLALKTQQDHVVHVLGEDKEADIVSLEAQLYSNLLDDVDVKQMEKKLTKDIPTFRVKHTTTADNQLQLQTFIGVLEPIQQTAVTEKSATPTGSDSASASMSESVPMKGSGWTWGMDKPSSAISSVGGLQKKNTRVFICSKIPETVVVHICFISENRLWVLYRPKDDSCFCLKLFNAEGKVLTTVENVKYCDGLLTIAGDVLLCWECWENAVQLITPDGSQSTHDMGIKVAGLVSCATKKSHYLKVCYHTKLCRVKFAFANDDQADSTELQHGTSHPKSQSTPHLMNRLTHSVTEVVFDETPGGWVEHVSVGGCYFAFSRKQKLQVYTKAGTRSSHLVCSYTAEYYITDVCFCQIGGQEMLVVIVGLDDKVHVVDHTGGGRFVGYLDTGTLHLHKPYCLTTDFDQHVWIGCDGGTVVVVDL